MLCVMRKIIIAGHGNFAEGMRSSLELIMGKQECISTVCAYLEFDNIEEKVDKIIQKIHEDDEVVVFTDLFGGSVNNVFMRYISNKNFHLIAGVNLLLLIEIVCHIYEDDLDVIIERALCNVHNSIVYCNTYKEGDVLSDF